MKSLLFLAFLNLSAPAALVAHYQFDEGQAFVANDSSGNGNNGTVVGATWNAANLNFDGVNDYVTIPNSPTINLTGNSMTVMAWVKWEIEPTTGNSWASIVNKNADGQFRLHHNPQNTKFEFAVSTVGSGGVVFSTTTPVINRWYHVTGVYDGAAIRILVDGQLEGSVAVSGNLTGSTSPLNIGNRAITNDRFFAGEIDDVRLYNNALNQSEISLAMIPEPSATAFTLLSSAVLLRRRRPKEGQNVSAPCA